jgi:hypothetical protein|tara:strand:- start:373 stop:669 length:297 start_codon:yes stop_codon:yes gene_type:complete
MKITKTQLKQIIKEELSKTINEEATSDQMVIDKVEEVLKFLIAHHPVEELAEAGLASVKLFEDRLYKNIQSHINEERARRAREPEEYTGEELPKELEL